MDTNRDRMRMLLNSRPRLVIARTSIGGGVGLIASVVNDIASTSLTTLQFMTPVVGFAWFAFVGSLIEAMPQNVKENIAAAFHGKRQLSIVEVLLWVLAFAAAIGGFFLMLHLSVLVVRQFS